MVSPRTRVDIYFASRFGGSPQDVVFRPGRVVLLGEHVDHQGGPVLASVLPEGIYVAWGVRPDRRVALHALNARGTDTFDPAMAVRSGRRWADLCRGVTARLVAEGRRLPGLNLAVFGDLPPEVGLASSAAYTSALLAAFTTAIDAPREAAQVARDVAEVERTWAGVACGTMDPYVAEVGRPGEIVHLDTLCLEHAVLALPAGVVLQPRDTGIRRRLSETPYNQRRQELGRALAVLQRRLPGLERLGDLTPQALAALGDVLPDPEARRARHVVTEVDRVRRAVAALEAGDEATLGALVDAGHESLSRDFECSLPPIEDQVRAVRREPGVLGVRLQGAGWGGSLAVLRRTTEPAPA